jgi:hypothetical protein
MAPRPIRGVGLGKAPGRAKALGPIKALDLARALGPVKVRGRARGDLVRATLAAEALRKAALAAEALGRVVQRRVRLIAQRIARYCLPQGQSALRNATRLMKGRFA